jgi:hypothetical protein
MGHNCESLRGLSSLPAWQNVAGEEINTTWISEFMQARSREEESNIDQWVPNKEE